LFALFGGDRLWPLISESFALSGRGIARAIRSSRSLSHRREEIEVECKLRAADGRRCALGTVIGARGRCFDGHTRYGRGASPSEGGRGERDIAISRFPRDFAPSRPRSSPFLRNLGISYLFFLFLLAFGKPKSSAREAFFSRPPRKGPAIVMKKGFIMHYVCMRPLLSPCPPSSQPLHRRTPRVTYANIGNNTRGSSTARESSPSLFPSSLSMHMRWPRLVA